MVFIIYPLAAPKLSALLDFSQTQESTFVTLTVSSRTMVECRQPATADLKDANWCICTLSKCPLRDAPCWRETTLPGSPEASTLRDRTIEHQPTQIAGNKPPEVGQGFSTIAWIPEEGKLGITLKTWAHHNRFWDIHCKAAFQLRNQSSKHYGEFSVLHLTTELAMLEDHALWWVGSCGCREIRTNLGPWQKSQTALTRTSGSGVF